MDNEESYIKYKRGKKQNKMKIREKKGIKMVAIEDKKIRYNIIFLK